MKRGGSSRGTYESRYLLDGSMEKDGEWWLGGGVRGHRADRTTRVIGYGMYACVGDDDSWVGGRQKGQGGHDMGLIIG